MTQQPTPVDTLIRDVMVVTMNAKREIIKDAAVAITGDRISHVGKSADIVPLVTPKNVVDGRNFVMTPGFVNGHIHITGEPITRGYVPDDSGWHENVWEWLVPLYQNQSAEEEAVSASLAALEMLRTGTTSFMEAGTIRFLEPVAESLTKAGIRGRIGSWAEDRAFDPSEDQTAKTDAAIKAMEQSVASLPGSDMIEVWPLLVGHITATDELWQAASAIARDKGARVSAHMSPATADPDWYLANTGKRPAVHLADIGVLGPEICLTHAVHMDDEEVAILAETGAHVIHCPMSAFKGAYGIGPAGKFPEMHDAGVSIMLGTDGNNNSNTSDLMRAGYLVSAVFKDARRDSSIFPAYDAFTMLTLGGAKGLGMQDMIGSIEVGKKADLVLHDTQRPEWQPLFNPIYQMIWSADGRAVHSVWVDGKCVVENYRSTMIDEQKLYADATQAGLAVTRKAGLPDKQAWPVI
ncbi:amidohydrolase family protein [Altericroceibacterium endophyticum]|uniref:Amidohydrolase family protein n=1 Tax=Altericroceibacterium endophyticum TaxID=1808508 RepID=A0A6I4T288_9SPHN|nr:amidohydrolase family protein [Altericroceibacterium endophyticum]MXO65026.1 amidohydrolase family protein [Altericroceibacterium endophyticum]